MNSFHMDVNWEKKSDVSETSTDSRFVFHRHFESFCDQRACTKHLFRITFAIFYSDGFFSSYIMCAYVYEARK